MSDKIYLSNMTAAIAEAYFKDFVYDPLISLDGQAIEPFRYSEQWVRNYLSRNAGNVHLAIMLDGQPVGEVIFKRIDQVNRSAVFSIHLQNDSVKNKGYGTQAEMLAIEYAFGTMNLKVIYADAVKKNTRSIRVLQKAGFDFVNEDEFYVYYEKHNAERS